MHKLLISTLAAFTLAYQDSCCVGQKIFESNGGYIGDHLTSLYNAYVYAKKYGLELALSPFDNSEIFECHRVLKPISGGEIDAARAQGKLIFVNSENDVIAHLHRPDVIFYVNVLSGRPTPDNATEAEARQLCMLNKDLNLDYLAPNHADSMTIAVHIRKGDGGVHYDGQLSSEQIFDFNRNAVHYTHDESSNPFRQRLRKTHRMPIDRWWATKFPPEQYYIDQINRVLRSKKVKGRKLVIKLFTDSNNPPELVARLKRYINNAHVDIEYYDNREKDINTRIAEDLYLM